MLCPAVNGKSCAFLLQRKWCLWLDVVELFALLLQGNAVVVLDLPQGVVVLIETALARSHVRDQIEFASNSPLRRYFAAQVRHIIFSFGIL